MSKREILDQIQLLPVGDKIWLVEETLKSLESSAKKDISMAAETMADEYKTNKELTAFTDIDLDDFYEPMRS